MNYIEAIKVIAVIPPALVALGFLVATIRTIVTGKLPREYTFTLTDEQVAQLQASQEGGIHRRLVALDIFCNVMFFNGREDETISTHSWRASQAGSLWGKLMTDWLNLFQSDHGFKAAAGDLQRAESIAATEEKSLKV